MIGGYPWRMWLMLAGCAGALGACGTESGKADLFAPEVAMEDMVVAFGEVHSPGPDALREQEVMGPDLVHIEVIHPDIPPLDLPPPVGDADNDGIPDTVDPFPADGDRPGTSSAMSVYMHTSDELWKLDVKSHDITKVGDFVWPSGWSNDQMTDIAIDRWGVLYGVTFDNAYVCHPETAECWSLGSLPDSFNGLTLVPKGTVSPDQDVLIGVAGDGGWYRLNVMGGEVFVSKLGEFGGPYSSSGDAYSIAGAGTYAAANKTGATHDVLVQLDPKTGKVLGEVGPLTGYASVWGLAGWTDKAFAFDAGGDIAIVDTTNGQILELLQESTQPWWGAGVRTLIF